MSGNGAVTGGLLTSKHLPLLKIPVAHLLGRRKSYEEAPISAIIPTAIDTETQPVLRTLQIPLRGTLVFGVFEIPNEIEPQLFSQNPSFFNCNSSN